ncbi:hypothetical protein DEMA109039_10175 [Deinococcus marmoris]
MNVPWSWTCEQEGNRTRRLGRIEDADTSMGDGEHASQGVINGTNLPPWDTRFAVLPLECNVVLLARIPGLAEPQRRGSTRAGGLAE